MHVTIDFGCLRVWEIEFARAVKDFAQSADWVLTLINRSDLSESACRELPFRQGGFDCFGVLTDRTTQSLEELNLPREAKVVRLKRDFLTSGPISAESLSPKVCYTAEEASLCKERILPVSCVELRFDWCNVGSVAARFFHAQQHWRYATVCVQPDGQWGGIVSLSGVNREAGPRSLLRQPLYKDLELGFINHFRQHSGRNEISLEKVICWRVAETGLSKNWAAEFLERLSPGQGSCGILIEDESIAKVLIEQFNMAGLTIPEDISLIVACGDDLECELQQPSLTNIDLDPRAAGTRAAELLRRLIEEKPCNPVETLQVEPRIQTRDSTSQPIELDEDLLAALDFIQTYANRGITVNDVLRQLAISRRSLELRFQDFLRRTPAQEIRRVRVEISKKLLLETDQSMARVAKESGFESAESFSRSFRRVTGQTPSAYRKSGGIATAIRSA